MWLFSGYFEGFVPSWTTSGPKALGSARSARLPYAVGTIAGLLESRQFQMLDAPEVTFLIERTYFSSPRTASIISNGGCLLFYESAEADGQSAVVAAARIVRVTGEPIRSVSLVSYRRGVLSPVQLEQMGSDEEVAVTAFDNLMCFDTR